VSAPETRPVAETHADRHAQPVEIIGRQHLGLLVADLLQTVFGVAQEFIRARQVAHRLQRQVTFCGEVRKHRQNAPLLKTQVTPAADQLKRLADKFDLADAARPELDVGLDALRSSSRWMLALSERISSTAV